jgi:AcrR family transcriptional regulator
MRPQNELSRLNQPERLAQIYRTAARIICEKGYDATSLNDVADAVGLTKPGLYHYITSKESLLFGIMNFAMDRVQAEVVEPVQAVADAEEQLRTLITRHARLIMERGQEITLLVDEMAGLTRAHRRVVTERQRAYFELVRSILKRLSDEGKLRDVDVTVAAFSLFGMLLWVSRWYRPDGRLTSEQVADQIIHIAYGGLIGAGPHSADR